MTLVNLIARANREAKKAHRSLMARQRRAANPEVAERHRQRMRDWRAANPEVAERHRQRMRDWRAANPEKARAVEAKWRAANPEKYRETHRKATEARTERLRVWRKENPAEAYALRRRNNLKSKYRLTEGDYQAMWKSQQGCCAICRKDFSDAGRCRPAVDHCHRTGLVRALLCSFCNTRLATLESPEWCEAASAYLAEHRGKAP
jgi:hypothetical protein